MDLESSSFLPFFFPFSPFFPPFSVAFFLFPSSFPLPLPPPSSSRHWLRVDLIRSIKKLRVLEPDLIEILPNFRLLRADAQA